MSDFPDEEPDPEMFEDHEEKAVWNSDQPIRVLRQIGAQYDSEKVDSCFSKSPEYSQPSRSKKKTLCRLHTPDWHCESEANERSMW